MRRILRLVLGLFVLINSLTFAVADGKDILVGNSYILKEYDFEVIFLENNRFCFIENDRFDGCGTYHLSGNKITVMDFEGEESMSGTVSRDGTFLILDGEKLLLRPYDPNYLNGKREAIDKYIEKNIQEAERYKLHKKKLENESIEKFGYIDSLYVESNGSNSRYREENVLTVWSFTDEIESFIYAEGYGYKVTHPNVEVEYTFIPTDQFPSKLDPVLASGNGAPDVFCLDDAFVRKYVESGLLLPLDDIYEEVKNKMADYPIKVGSYNGHVYAMSWNVCPGAMFYRRSYAKKYWGTDDPVEVQKKVKDLDAFIATARELNRISKGKCKMVSTYEDLFLPYKGARKKPWVLDDEKLLIDPAMEKYMEMAKIFYDEELDGRTSQWAEGWYAGMNDRLVDERGNQLEVMAYFLPTWGLHYVLKTDASNTGGDWAMCAGPSSWSWGGTWIAAYKGTKKPEAAKEMIRYLATDDKFLEAMANSSGDVVGNFNVQNNVKENFSEPYLVGQNNYAMFCELSKNVDGSLTLYADQQIEVLFAKAVKDYAMGKKTKQKSLYDFKKQVETTMGYY